MAKIFISKFKLLILKKNIYHNNFLNIVNIYIYDKNLVLGLNNDN